MFSLPLILIMKKIDQLLNEAIQIKAHMENIEIIIAECHDNTFIAYYGNGRTKTFKNESELMDFINSHEADTIIDDISSEYTVLASLGTAKTTTTKKKARKEISNIPLTNEERCYLQAQELKELKAEREEPQAIVLKYDNPKMEELFK